jgi:hypothetical protein
MEIDINCIRGKSPDGGTDGLCQKTQAVALVEGMVRSCKAVSNYETASLQEGICHGIARKEPCVPRSGIILI